MKQSDNLQNKKDQQGDTKKTGDNVKETIISQIKDQIKSINNVLNKYQIQLPKTGSKTETDILSSKYMQKHVIEKEIEIINGLCTVNVRYESYLNQYAFYLMRKQMIFQSLCNIISKHNIFQSHGVYPLNRSWQLETPFKKNFQKKEYFIAPGQSAYLAFSVLSNDILGVDDLNKTININNDALINKIIIECNDAYSKNNLLSNFHPMQNFVSLIIKYPEIIYLLGQHIQNMTQRIGMYYGFLMAYNNMLINPNNINNNFVNIDTQSKQIHDVILPNCYSMLNTPFVRLIYFAALKQILTNEADIINWVDGYHYYPYKNNVSKYALYDLLFAIGSQQQCIEWVQEVFKRIVQKLYNEKTFDLFKIIFNSKNNVIQYIQPLLQKMIGSILSSLDTLPDIIKSVFTVVKIVITNVVLNIVHIMQSGDTSKQMTNQLTTKYPQIYEIIDQKNEVMTSKRIKLLIQYMFKQFFGQFIFGAIIRQGLNNLTAFGLLEIEQLNINSIDTFYSNLSFLGDLLYHSFMYRMDKHKIFFSQFNQVKDNPQSGVKTQQLTEQQQQKFKQFLREMKSFYDDISNPQYNNINYDKVTYNINSTSIRKILNQEEYNIESLLTTSGLWATTGTFLQFLLNKFKESKDYLIQNFEILDKNCQHLIQNVYQIQEFDNDSSIEQLFMTTTKVTLFSLLKIKIEQVCEITTEEKVAQFNSIIQSKSNNGNNITIVPFFNDILRQKKPYEGISRHSVTFEELNQILKQLQNESVQQDNDKEEISYTHDKQATTMITDVISQFEELVNEIGSVNYTNEEEFYTQISDYQEKKNQLFIASNTIIQEIDEKYSSVQRLSEYSKDIEGLQRLLDQFISNISDKEPSKSVSQYEQPYESDENSQTEDQYIIPLKQQLLKQKNTINDLVSKINKQYSSSDSNALSTAYMKNSILYKLFQKPLTIIPFVASDIYTQLFPQTINVINIDDSDSMSQSDLND